MFNNLIEVTQYFSDKQRCIDYLSNIRWNGNVACPLCGHDKVYKLNGADKRWKCSSCRKPFSVTKGTIFENSPVPLQKWFVALYLMSNHKKGISSIQLSKDISVTQKTAWFMLHRLRAALELKSFSTPIMNGIVEIDECYIGGKESNKHKSKRTGTKTSKKAAVLGIVERNGSVVAMRVKKATVTNVFPHIKSIVGKDAQVMTDEANLYSGLYKLKVKSHETVNHSAGMYKYGNCHTNTIEGFWSLLQRGILGIYHSVSVKHIDRYVDEFEFRYNNRKLTPCDLFTSMLSLSNHKRLTYKNLITNHA